jgi:hypothetical protein
MHLYQVSSRAATGLAMVVNGARSFRLNQDWRTEWWYTPRMATKKKTQKKLSKKKAAPKKKLAKKPSRKKVVVKAKGAAKKTARGKTAAPPKKRVRGKSEFVGSVSFEAAGLGARSGGQSGDLQGLSNRRGASSESVDELLEEGNAFEAEIVKGVEDVADEEEVHTHEVPEDDVPGEYLDKD